MNWDKLGDELKARLQREHPDVFGPQGIQTGIKSKSSAVTPVAEPTKRADKSGSQPRKILSAEDKLNKTEKMLLVLLRAMYLNPSGSAPVNVRIQAIRLELAPNCTYTPDFSVWFMGKMIFYEAKGAFVRDDAIVKLKTAARLYPEFDFWLCQRKNNKWTEKLMPK